MKAFFVSVLADLIARTKAAHLVGHMGQSGCGKCKIKGVTPADGLPTYYHPCRTPRGVQRQDFSPDDRQPTFPEARDTASLEAAVAELAALEGNARRQAQLHHGVTSQTPWITARFFDFPSFFPIDLMHLLWCNFTPFFFQLIMGKVEGYENAAWVLTPAQQVCVHSILKGGVCFTY
jgi:hypothetical protein